MDICTCARMVQDDKQVTYSAAKQLLQGASEGLENLSVLTESVKKTVQLYELAHQAGVADATFYLALMCEES